MKYEDLSRLERARLLVSDWEAYRDSVPEGHWLLLLDGLAGKGVGPIEEDPALAAVKQRAAWAKVRYRAEQLEGINDDE